MVSIGDDLSRYATLLTLLLLLSSPKVAAWETRTQPKTSSHYRRFSSSALTIEDTDTFGPPRRKFLENIIKSSSSLLICPTICGYGADKALALSPEQAASDYDRYAAKYDDLDGGQASTFLGIDDARTKLFGQAQGSILEIGAGTGLNLNKYDPKKIKRLTMVDISPGMLEEAQQRLESLIKSSPAWKEVSVRFVKADATSELVKTFGTQEFDTVVDSFSLCVMGNAGAPLCLQQICQVVKTKENGGKVLLLENSRSSNPLLGLYQDATADTAAMAGGKGCVYNQDVRGLLQAIPGLAIEQEDMYAAGLFRAFECTMTGKAKS